MLIKCIKIISPVTKEDLGDKSPWLIKGKEYVVLALNISSKCGIIVCLQTEHYNEPAYFSLNGFEIISQYMPTNWITLTKQIDDETFIDILPQSWSYNGFFIDLEDENYQAIKLFNKEAELIYREEGKI
jgi:hypothetical protein